MTVDTRPPIVRYDGNGSEVTYAWDWKMIDDSTINVNVDNELVTNWSVQGTTVVFETAPADGAEIIIWRRTKIWQPQNYRPFGWFSPSKTELNMDRAIMITQERQGDSLDPSDPNGMVGGANLSMSRQPYTLTVISERGTDAVLPLYDYGNAIEGYGNVVNLLDNVVNGTDNVINNVVPPVPDVTILWEGEPIISGIYSLPGNTNGVAATIRFRMDLLLGDPDKAYSYYPNYNATAYSSWLSADPADNEYWMRVTGLSVPGADRYTISDGDNNRVSGEAFSIKGSAADSTQGPYVSVFTFGDTAPSTQTGTFEIEICKDLSGVPDGDWASRNVTLEAILNADAPPPVSTAGSVSWESFFGRPFELGSFYGNTDRTIPLNGLSIRFTVPLTSTAYRCDITAIESTWIATVVTGAVNQTVMDFVSGATYSWGLGGGIKTGINYPGTQLDLIPGQTYFFNVRNESPVSGGNWLTLQVSTQEP